MSIDPTDDLVMSINRLSASVAQHPDTHVKAFGLIREATEARIEGDEPALQSALAEIEELCAQLGKPI